MKAIFYVLTFFWAFMLVDSCQKEVTVTDDDLCHTWEATTFISVESVAYPKKDNYSPQLTFKRDGTYNLKLDINSCGGTYRTGKGQLIELEIPTCTEACCDSQFSNKLASTLPKVTSYSIEDNTLQLNVPGWGYIELEVVEED